MKLEDMPVVTVEEVLRFRAEAIKQRNALSAVVERLKTCSEAMIRIVGDYIPSQHISMRRIINDVEKAIEETPATALRLHEAGVLERAVIGIRRRAGQVDSDGRHLECAGLEDAATYIEQEIARLRAGGEG